MPRDICSSSTPWTLKAVLEFTLSSITGLFKFCISVNLDQIYRLTPQLLTFGAVGGKGRGWAGKHAWGPMLGLSRSVCSCVHFFLHFSFRDTEKGQGPKSYLKGLGRSEVADISSKS